MSLIDRVRSSVIRDSEENYYSSTTLPLELIPAVIGHEAQYTPELVATLSQDEHTHTHTHSHLTLLNVIYLCSGILADCGATQLSDSIKGICLKT